MLHQQIHVETSAKNQIETQTSLDSVMLITSVCLVISQLDTYVITIMFIVAYSVVDI